MHATQSVLLFTEIGVSRVFNFPQSVYSGWECSKCTTGISSSFALMVSSGCISCRRAGDLGGTPRKQRTTHRTLGRYAQNHAKHVGRCSDCSSHSPGQLWSIPRSSVRRPPAFRAAFGIDEFMIEPRAFQHFTVHDMYRAHNLCGIFVSVGIAPGST